MQIGINYQQCEIGYAWTASSDYSPYAVGQYHLAELSDDDLFLKQQTGAL